MEISPCECNIYSKSISNTSIVNKLYMRKDGVEEKFYNTSSNIVRNHKILSFVVKLSWNVCITVLLH